MATILFLTELLPYPLVSGAKIRAYYVLRYLATRHEVTLVSFTRPDDRPEARAHLGSFLHGVQVIDMKRSSPRNLRAALVSLLTGRPAIIAREEIAGMRRRVRELLGTGWFDVVHADQIPMARYGLLGRGHGARTLLDEHNATFQVIGRLARGEPKRWKRMLLEREARAFARYEDAVCRAYDAVTFVTDEDRRAVQAMGAWQPAPGRTAVIPICVDTGAVHPVAPVAAPFRVTHVGTMFWPPNVEGMLWFWEKVWPLVLAQVPSARLTIVGKNPPPSLKALAAKPETDVLGYVEDLGQILAETAVFVVPLHSAGGMRVKIVDAWCWGLPVVSTTIGAEGIALREGENILIADAPGAFAESVVQVMRDAELSARLRVGGRVWVEKHYDWRRIYPAWDAVYEAMLGQGSGGAGEQASRGADGA